MKDFKEYDRQYSNYLRILNPKDSVPYKLDVDMPQVDSKAYKLNPHYRHLYDKLFVTQSQHVQGGELSELKHTNVTYPVFIKPRYGHKTSSSKNCYKINSKEELTPHFHKKHMMWSEFIKATEGMTDFVIVNGEIVYQLTYVYSDEQYGFADVWKYTSSESKPPQQILEWVHKHLAGYTGPLNVQYRDTTIIEIGLRFARRGMYIESTNNKTLIDAINHMWKTKTWHCREDIVLRPFYSFKCWSAVPVLCLMPHHIVHAILIHYGAMNFYEYYFEPTGKSSTIFFQFLHEDFEKGMKLKNLIEHLLYITNGTFIIGCSIAISCTVLNIPCKPLLYALLVMFLLSLDNSLLIMSNQLTHQAQFFI
jgi:hypothetical protein